MKLSFTKVASLSARGVAAATYPVAAHHSTTMFDREKLLPLVGTVKELHWTNPHVAIFIDNTAGQGAASGLWVIEYDEPGQSRPLRWTRTVVKPGDKVTADIHPLRDGTKGGALRKITLTTRASLIPITFATRNGRILEQEYGK